MQICPKRVMLTVLAITLLATGSVFASSTNPSPGASAEDRYSAYLSEQASTLLSEIQKEAAELRPHAEQLDTFKRSTSLNWRTHAASLSMVKGHINTVAIHLTELQRIQGQVAPWQRQAISEVAAHAAQLATSTQAAIVHLRENRDRLFVEEYRGHLATIADRSEMMEQAVGKYLDFEETQQKLERLQNELEIARN